MQNKIQNTTVKTNTAKVQYKAQAKQEKPQKEFVVSVESDGWFFIPLKMVKETEKAQLFLLPECDFKMWKPKSLKADGTLSRSRNLNIERDYTIFQEVKNDEGNSERAIEFSVKGESILKYYNQEITLEELVKSGTSVTTTKSNKANAETSEEV